MCLSASFCPCVLLIIRVHVGIMRHENIFVEQEVGLNELGL